MFRFMRGPMLLAVIVAMRAALAPVVSAQKAKDTLIPAKRGVFIDGASPFGRWPQFAAGQKRRVHVWYEEGIWHFRCTCGINATAFDGTITLDKGRLQIVGGDGEFEQKDATGSVKNPRKADYLEQTPNGIAFRFQCVGNLDGLDFTVPKEAKTIDFAFLVNNESKAEFIFIGAAGTNPSKAKFTLSAHPK